MKNFVLFIWLVLIIGFKAHAAASGGAGDKDNSAPMASKPPSFTTASESSRDDDCAVPGIPAPGTGEKYDGAEENNLASAEGGAKSTMVYELLPNGDCRDSNGGLYRKIERPIDYLLAVKNGGVIAPDGSKYYVVRPHGVGGAGAGVEDIPLSSDDSLRSLTNFRNLTQQIKIVLSKTDEELAEEGITRTEIMEIYRSLSADVSSDTPIETLEKHEAAGREVTGVGSEITDVDASGRAVGLASLMESTGSIKTVTEITDTIWRDGENLDALEKVVKSLSVKQKKALLNSQDIAKMKPLEMALRCNKIKLALYLFREGARWEIQDTTLTLPECVVGFLDQLITTSAGLDLLSIPENVKGLEKYNTSFPELAAKLVTIKELRRAYDIFTKKLRVDISGEAGILFALEQIAHHILSQSSESFSDLARDKAERILRDLPIAKIKREVDMQIIEMIAQVEEIKKLLGNLRRAKDKRVGEHQINEACEKLSGSYATLKGRTKAHPEWLRSLNIELGTLKRFENDGVKKWLTSLGLAEKETESNEITEKRLPRVEGRSADRFDVETTRLDLESLNALLTSSHAHREEILARLTASLAKAKAEAEGKKSTISAKALKRFIEKIRYMLAYQQERLDKGVTAVLNMALNRSVSNQFIWDVLYYSQDERLQAAYEAIDSLAISDKDTVIKSSVSESLIAPGGKLRPHDRDDGGSTLGGSTIGGYGRLKEVDEVDEVDEDDTSEGMEDVSTKYTLPADLDSKHIDTLKKLYGCDYTNIPEDGSTIIALFKNLPGFEVRNEGGKIVIKHTSGYSATSHKKHTKDYKGLNPAFAGACLNILKTLGIEKSDFETDRVGGAGAGAGTSATVASAAAGGGKKRGGSNSPTNLGATSFEAMAGAGAAAGGAGTGASKARDAISVAGLYTSDPRRPVTVHFTGVRDGSEVHLIPSETTDRRIKALFDEPLKKDLSVIARENGLIIHLWKNAVSSGSVASQNIEHYETIGNDSAAAVAPTSVHLLNVGEGRYQLLKMLES